MGSSRREADGSQAREWPLAGVSVLHALAFTTAAALLPWSEYALFALLTTALALGHWLTAVAALARPAQLSRVWRATAWLSLGWLLVLTWSVATSALYMARIYGALGSGIAIALLIGWCIPILFTVPLACWSLAATGGVARRRSGTPSTRRSAPAKLVVPLLMLSLLGLSWHKLAEASTRPLEAAAVEAPAWPALIRQQLPAYRDLPKPEQQPAPLPLDAIRCQAPVDSQRATLFVHYRAEAKGHAKSVARCLQAPSTGEALRKAAGLLRSNAVRHPITLDLVTGIGALSSNDPLLDGFKLRPGLDGACDGGTCLLGWQLAARHMLNENVPVSAVPELRMGVSARRVRAALGGDGERGLDGLSRITTASFLYSERLERLSRMHRAEQPLSRETVRRASRLAERHIAHAVGPDGRYRYQLDPFTGDADHEGYNLPRQAGTTLVLCEFGSESTLRRQGKAALAQMAGLAVNRGEKSLLLPAPGDALGRLGDQALPLIAFLVCREALGTEHDKLIGGLAHTVLAMQRPAGDFYPAWDTQSLAPSPGPPPLFSPGQAVMALVLLERVVKERPGRHFPELERIRSAVDRAMHYYGEQYWDFPLGKLFYVEENWHCLAARAALTHHRVDAYERFCIEHAEFKARFVVGDESPTEDMQGAFALAALIPPPNTATAGVGEALAAAVALKQARGEDTQTANAQLQRILRFLLRQQWDESTCFACSDPELVAGGYSDSMLTPTMRIDFTQHAWAAIRHGAHVLGLGEPARSP